MDFLKLVQKKDHKIDNRIILFTVITVILIISVIVFWPKNFKYPLVAYLSDNTSFYVHLSDKDYLKNDIVVFNDDLIQAQELESVLGSNFFNLKELILFKIDDKLDNYYLLRFSRLPKTFVKDLTAKNSSWHSYVIDKNIVFLTKGELIEGIKANPDKQVYFEEGVTVYESKNYDSDFLKDWSNIISAAFSDEDLLINWQKLPKGVNRFSLIGTRRSESKNFNRFFTPKEFDTVFAFSDHNLDQKVVESLSNNILKVFFDSLPYYNLSTQDISDRILKDSILWQKGDQWLLASHRPFDGDILSFIKSFNVEEVNKVLSDGTAYTEFVAADNQNTIEHQINGQKVLQIDQLFVWDIANQHYLSNNREFIEKLSADNYYLSNIFKDCLDNTQLQVEDIVYFSTNNIPDSALKQYLLSNNIDNLQAFSYSDGNISGLNICF